MESGEQRVTWERRRLLFDSIADSYASSRRSYPLEIVEWMMLTADVTPESRVLEIGCGTGQLTAQLASFGPYVTAIDIGASMIEPFTGSIRMSPGRNPPVCCDLAAGSQFSS